MPDALKERQLRSVSILVRRQQKSPPAKATAEGRRSLFAMRVKARSSSIAGHRLMKSDFEKDLHL